MIEKIRLVKSKDYSGVLSDSKCPCGCGARAIMITVDLEGKFATVGLMRPHRVKGDVTEYYAACDRMMERFDEEALDELAAALKMDLNQLEAEMDGDENPQHIH